MFCGRPSLIGEGAEAAPRWRISALSRHRSIGNDPSDIILIPPLDLEQDRFAALVLRGVMEQPSGLTSIVGAARVQCVL
jgi:hypothetical protein